jgi:N-acetylated-alpha-linked acidic dipeptidase
MVAVAQSMRGYPDSQAVTEQSAEHKAQAIPQPDRIRQYMERMAQQPHHAGSPMSASVAQYALGLFKSFGLDAHIEEFEALIPYPTTRVVEMTAPVKYTLKLKEPAVPGDADTADPGQLPTYNAYSAAGDVSGPLVYVNYGIPADYDALAKQGIDVKGKIVIARYGGSWRGIKPKVAAEHGAVGCIIYSDPRDDGYYQGDVYPRGALRPPDGVQRGSVMDMPLAVGDPLSPGWASEKGSRRLTRQEAKTLMTIPVLPISYADATPLLQHLEGPVAPLAWRGALGFTYHIGPGPSTVHMKLDFDWATRPLHDVIATIPGSEFPNEWVVYGNHHDAWVNGAHDPISGAASLLEAARALGELSKQGWKPKRTIVFALWDGEEFGLLGSTEWAEKHSDELTKKAVVYINSDSNGQGSLGASGSHTLERFMIEVLGDLKDPRSGKTLLEAARTRRRDAADPDGPAPDPAKPQEFHLGALGAGSDYVAFVDHTGVASLNLGFGGANQGGVYHSIYDDMAWFKRFGDPDFIYGRTLSQVTATTLMRLADAPVLPFEFGALSSTIKTYVTEIEKLAGDHVNFHPILSELTKIDTDATAYEQALKDAVGRGSSADFAKVNDVLFHSERSLILTKGLPRREWYKHQIYAPGMYTGYGVKTLPGIREASEAKNWDEANQQVTSVAEVLSELDRRIQEATRLLGPRL